MAKPAQGFCEAQVLLPEFTTLTILTSIRYFVPAPGTPITGLIAVSGTDTPAMLNNKFLMDPIRAVSGFSITVVSFTEAGLTVRIVKKSPTQIEDLASGQVFEQNAHTAPFICTPRKRKPGVGAPAAAAVQRFLNERMQAQQGQMGGGSTNKAGSVFNITENESGKADLINERGWNPTHKPVTGPTSNRASEAVKDKGNTNRVGQGKGGL